jgi:hypothetical protein
MLRSLFSAAVVTLAVVSAPAQVVLTGPSMNEPGLVTEYNRAIRTLRLGMARHWSNPDHYLRAFDKMSRTGTAGEPLTAEYLTVRSLLAQHFALFPETPGVWDEQFPEQFPGQHRIGSALASLEGARDALLLAEKVQRDAQRAAPGPLP